MFHREYERKVAVKGLSFKINEGEFAGFIGPNGAGKSTTLKMLTGILTPSSGTADVIGCTPWKRSMVHRRQISIVMGNRSQLIWDLPPLETFGLNKEMYQIPKVDFDKDLTELSELLGVDHLLKVQTRKLSLGERMKMEIIGAVLHRPRVLFLDEPTIGLDLFAQRHTREFLKDYNKRYGSTILLTSHYLEDIKELCDRLLVIDKGQMLYDGQTNQIVNKLSLHKFITVSFKQRVSPERIVALGGTIVTEQLLKMVIRVPRNNVTRLAGEMLNMLPVEDLTIEDPSIEDVIENVYSGEGIKEGEAI
nr:ATP-binding cassette domain-containing protein [Paenibacillus sediminis]